MNDPKRCPLCMVERNPHLTPAHAVMLGLGIGAAIGPSAIIFVCDDHCNRASESLEETRFLLRDAKDAPS